MLPRPCTIVQNQDELPLREWAELEGEKVMVNVLASIRVVEGRKADFIEIFKANVPNVLNEDGCIEYIPTIDFPTGFESQELNENLVTIIEKWESLDHLKAHLSAPHMKSYQEQVKDMVEHVGLKVLGNA